MKLLFLFSIACAVFAGQAHQQGKGLSVPAAPVDSVMQYKLNSFAVLQHKCNVCHAERNRHAVFTFTNMNAWSGQINEQVFVKMRMPKGNTVVLTAAERATLKKWITSLNGL